MDIVLHYIDQGQGPPLVMLHGNGESSDYFKAQIDYFSTFRRVIAVDTRGHGRSPRGTGPQTLSRYADDLKSLLDSLCISQPDILGFSDGGNIALIFALRYPGAYGRLILNGANLYPLGLRLVVLLPILIGWCVQSLLAFFCVWASHTKERLALMLFEPSITPASLAAITAPVLVIAGTRDVIRPRHTELISRSIKGAQLVILPGSHFVAAENSEAFNRAVSEFLAR